MPGRRQIHFEPKDEPKSLLRDVVQGDIIILIAGPTAVGKSAFINNILQSAGSNQTAGVGDGEKPCTDQLTSYKVKLPGDRHAVLVDSPGFDHGNVADAIQLVSQIADWLALLHDRRLTLGAIVFMYPINRPGRVTNTDIANFRVICELCGPRHFPRIIPVTTQWNQYEVDGEKRENCIWSEFWKGIWYRNPVIVYRLRDTNEDAYAVLGSIIKRIDSLPTHSAPLTIQKELAEEGKTFENTATGQVLESVLVKKTGYPRRYSISRFVSGLRQPTIQNEDVMETTKVEPLPMANVQVDDGGCIEATFGRNTIPSYYYPFFQDVQDGPLLQVKGSALSTDVKSHFGSEAVKTSIEPPLAANFGLDDDGGDIELSSGSNPYNSQQHYLRCNCSQGVVRDELSEELPTRPSTIYNTAPVTPTQEPEPFERDRTTSIASSYRTAPLGSAPTTPIIPHVYAASSFSSFSSSSTTLRHAPPSDTGTSSSTTVGDVYSTPQYQHQQDITGDANRFDAGGRHNIHGAQPQQGGIVINTSHFYCPHHSRRIRPRHATL